LNFTLRCVDATTLRNSSPVSLASKDAAYHVWRVSDLRGSTVVTMTFTIFFTSMLATLRLFDRLGIGIDPT
jgi:hypothetical protein